MDGINVKISGSFLGDFEETLEELPNAERRGLYKAAYYLRDKIQQSLISKLPKATQQNPKYKDTLADAILFTRVDGNSTTLTALGTRDKSSGTFRTRFFEEDTRERFQKSRNGVRLKKKKSLGHITGVHFFNPTVATETNAVQDIIVNEITKYIKIASNG